MQQERRKYKRHPVHEDVYVYRSKRIGKILNISLGGMLCQCAHHSKCATVDFDIFCPGSCICLSGLPFKVIREEENVKATVKDRQCHVEFADLNAAKTIELKNFIDAYSVPG
jgi:hypothetical protein